MSIAPAAKLDNRREIELAEGVQIYLRPAGLFPRLIARVIDGFLWGTIYTILSLLLVLPGAFLGQEISQGFLQLLAFVMFWFYDPLFEAGKHSATPGKRALGLKVVRRSGAPVGFASAFLRGLLFWIDVLPGCGSVGIVSILASRQSQRLGDRVADTLVVYQQPVQVPELPEIAVPAVSPGVPLSREEQLAFIGFADRAAHLNAARQLEVTAALAELPAAQQSPQTTSFALGVARWLSRHEQ
ncbi:RDD family protein [Roseibacillus ishigakijimensis]|uniref:RDD family protein n=1 Tax=Roseibacillus ishigakijimensis TaxID=454146 RepID=A0A934RP28_9BACT|nr:RDD family protein [Roseibacillus ishigakijimensis]MBK1832873.1 RDD family protein [Roseibacillus ishigakijimensis]